MAPQNRLTLSEAKSRAIQVFETDQLHPNRLYVLGLRR
jgi:hypothetical protein